MHFQRLVHNGSLLRKKKMQGILESMSWKLYTAALILCAQQYIKDGHLEAHLKENTVASLFKKEGKSQPLITCPSANAHLNFPPTQHFKVTITARRM